MLTVDARIKSILHWLNHSLKMDIKHFELASSDASFRRYFRVIHSKGQQVVMDAPPEQESINAFIQISALFQKSGINVPEIYHQNLAQGFLLLEDFGSCSLLDQLNDNTVSNFYKSAFQTLYKLHSQKDIFKNQIPFYNQGLLIKELDIFYDWFLNQSLTLTLNESVKNNLNTVLITSALEQPQVCVHRDFHSRNLMVLEKNSLGIIDFQDAVIGPISYDLVSLLRDCYISWPEDKVNYWMSLYFQLIKESGLINVDIQTFTQWFDLMGLQRHLKAIGIFSRLHLRDNKSNYLADIPRTMTYVSQICNKYPALEEFNETLIQTILPAYKNKQ